MSEALLARSFDPRAIVAAKRDGAELRAQEIRAFTLGYARGEIPDHLAAAFLMAAYLKGLSFAETSAMTRAMIDSGVTVPLDHVHAPTVDKHSTGGVSDGVTLVFAPLAASLGLAVAKLSGRGLGHTGGTLDKLESIPGLRTSLSIDELERLVELVGCAVAGQSPDLVPADGAFYALRDATATVGSIPLIAASVMSKKLAVQDDLILLDVKTGSGAFMKTPDRAAELAELCVRLATDEGRRARAAVTDMSQPLGTAIGNALEIEETVRVLRGEERGPLRDLAVMFVAEALIVLAGGQPDGAHLQAAAALDDGRALRQFGRMVEAQGGDRRVVDDPWAVLPRAPLRTDIPAPVSGWLAAVDAEALGAAAVLLGAGRAAKGDPIDPAVGIELPTKIGHRVVAGQPLGVVHARGAHDADQACAAVLGALTFADGPVSPPPLLYGWHPTDR